MSIKLPITTAKDWRKGLATGAVAGAGMVTTVAVGTAAVATYFVRQMVVPPKHMVEELKILGVGYPSFNPASGDEPNSITLPATEQTSVPGTYGLFFNGGKSHAVIGDIIAFTPVDQTVIREVLEIHNGDLSRADRGHWSGVIATSPEDAGYKAEHITLPLTVGDAPAWIVRPQNPENIYEDHSDTWAVMVHGMGVQRSETLRALATTQELNLTSLHISYRNDKEAPPSSDGRYGLGFTEWKDVETAIDYALQHGARKVVLFGWSMGGSICLQAADKARNKDAIAALVLDGPAVDWLKLIEYHTELNKLPLGIGKLGIHMISSASLGLFTGLDEPIELESLSWTRRVDEMQVPTLILHSVKDDFVPVAPALELARKSNTVDIVTFADGAHTKEWNVDSDKWHSAVTEWLPGKLQQFHAETSAT